MAIYQPPAGGAGRWPCGGTSPAASRIVPVSGSAARRLAVSPVGRPELSPTASSPRRRRARTTPPTAATSSR